MVSRRNRRLAVRNVILGVLIGSILVAWPAAAGAAASIGMVLPRDCAVGVDAKEKIATYLFDQGFNPGDIEVFTQRPAPDKVSRLNSIRKFLSFGVDILLVWGGTGIEEAIRESGRTPIVFVGVYDPVKSGIVKDLNSPGKYVTGVSAKTSMPFLLDNILEVSGSSTLGVIYHSEILDSQVQLEEMNQIALGKGIDLVTMDVREASMNDARSVLASAPFLYLAQGCYVQEHRFADLKELGKPAATQTPGVTGGGVILTLAPEPEELLRESAVIIGRIIRGEKPSEIPITRVKKIDLVINLNEARDMGIKVPFPVLKRGTKVIK